MSQLNTYIKSILEEDRFLKNVTVCGEISNFKHHYQTGHFYLTLKDDECNVKAVMFKYSAQKMIFTPKDGLKVIVKGKTSVYTKDGQYQLYIDDMKPQGIGGLNLAYNELKERLEKQGLFDVEHKLEIPRFPQKIALITSSSGAAYHDFISITSRRFPFCEIVFAPVLVQGAGASEQIIDAINKISRLKNIDVIVITRGGGSVEDLWEFNSEQLAKTIYKLKIPVVSAVGHETDFTICDYVSDLRAPTPSAAAELVTPDISGVLGYIDNKNIKINRLLKYRLEEYKTKLLSFEQKIEKVKYTLIETQKNKIKSNYLQMSNNVQKIITSKKNNLVVKIEKLDALSPLKLLAKGFSVTYKDGQAISSVKSISKGDSLNVRLSDGSVDCTVSGIK